MSYRRLTRLPDAGDAGEIHALNLVTQRIPAGIRAFLDYMVPGLRDASSGE